MSHTEISSGNRQVDIAILGGGPVGCALAVFLQRQLPAPIKILLIDAQPTAKACQDPRTLALAYGSQQLLQAFGAWSPTANITPIDTIHVSRAQQFGRTLIRAREMRVPALGYVLTYGSILRGLLDALTRLAESGAGAQLTQLRPYRVELDRHAPEQPLHALSNAEHGPAHNIQIQARCIVNAEGGVYQPSATTASPGHNRLRERDYQQTAILAEIAAPAAPSRFQYCAFERFTAHGPFALLPTSASRERSGQANYALVWCCQPATAARLSNLDEASFNAAAMQIFGERLGPLQVHGVRRTYPLGLKAQCVLHHRNLIQIGNAAQTLHPVAGQGLNLGLRDAYILSQQLTTLFRSPTAPSDRQIEQALIDYAGQRCADRQCTIGLTDFLSQAFTWPGISTLGARALAVLDQSPGLRQSFARQMLFGIR